MRALIATASLLAACAPEAAAPDFAEEYWSIAIDAPEEYSGAVQYIDVRSIDEYDGARRAITVAFLALPPNMAQHAMRMDIVNDYDCANRRVRPVTTTVTMRGQAPSINRENQEWLDLDEHENMLAPFEFVCADPRVRAADPRFTRIEDGRPIDQIADARFAAHAEESGGD